MKGFARMTKLTNIGGRADYISNPKRQEEILAKSESVDWKPYQEFEKQHQMSSQRNNEGRELIIALPNDWSKLQQTELERRAQTLAETAVGKSTDMQWAVHWNKEHTNLHVHVIFSERQKEKSLGKWDRDIYLTEDGKVARRKADRAKNPDGSFKPPIHRKGEEKGGFTAKDTRYKQRSWLVEVKHSVKAVFERYGVVLDRPAPLREFHEGKGSESATIKLKNEIIRENNERLLILEKAGLDKQSLGKLTEVLLKPIKLKQISLLCLDNDGQLQIRAFKDVSRAYDMMERTRGQIQRALEPEKPQPEKRVEEPQELPQTPSELQIARIEALKERRKKLEAEASSILSEKKDLGLFHGKEKKVLDEKYRMVYRAMNDLDKEFLQEGVSNHRDADEVIERLQRRAKDERSAMEWEAKRSAIWGRKSVGEQIAEAKKDGREISQNRTSRTKGGREDR